MLEYEMLAEIKMTVDWRFQLCYCDIFVADYVLVQAVSVTNVENTLGVCLLCFDPGVAGFVSILSAGARNDGNEWKRVSLYYD